MDTNNFEKRYIRISGDSGCFLAHYKHVAENEDSIIVVDSNYDKSGRFKKNYEN